VLRITNFPTPAAARETGAVTATVYANFDKASGTLAQKMYGTEAKIPEVKFIPGIVTISRFSA